jgi:hypothetical protein
MGRLGKKLPMHSNYNKLFKKQFLTNIRLPAFDLLDSPISEDIKGTVELIDCFNNVISLKLS